MYPDVFVKFARNRQSWGDVDVLPTPQFYYGMKPGTEITFELEPGKSLDRQVPHRRRASPRRHPHRLLRAQRPAARGRRPRRKLEVKAPRAKADPAQPGQIGAPIPGVVSTVAVS